MATQRELNVAKFGGHELEAEGLALVRHALECDGRLTTVKCFEGARADFAVHLGDPDRALGVQLKTTRRARRPAPAVEDGCRQYVFSGTTGYEGLAVLCIALDSRIRMWFVPGDAVTGESMRIPTESRSSRQGYCGYETFELDLADDLCRALREPEPHYVLRPVEELVRPVSVKGQAEYEAYRRLEAALPLEFEPARVEGSPHDCTVAGARWQLKLASLEPRTDRYQTSVQKAAGRLPGKKRKHSQYAAEDFDYLCVQLPADRQCAYLFPMRLLLARGLAGRLDCSAGTIHFYPHRKAHKKTSWVEAFRLDLSDRRAALAAHRRITSS